MVSKKLLKTVTIGIATIKEIKNELKVPNIYFFIQHITLILLSAHKTKGGKPKGL